MTPSWFWGGTCRLVGRSWFVLSCGRLRAYLGDLRPRRLHLRAAGRHAHDAAGDDIPDPAPGQGFSWHFDAWRLVWSNEVYTRSLYWWHCWWRFIFPWPWCWRWFFRRPVKFTPTTLVDTERPSPTSVWKPKP